MIKSIAVSFMIIYGYNRFLTRHIVKTRAVTSSFITYLSPTVEESAKTLMGVFFDVPLLTVHVGIGFLEFMQDTWTTKSIWPGCSALVSHTGFGFITVIVIWMTGNLIVGLLAAVLCHVGFNYLIMASQT